MNTSFNVHTLHSHIDDMFNPFMEHTIGFEPLFRRWSDRSGVQSREKYPPYNITRGSDENKYSITLAVAGFKEEDLEVEVKEDTLTISGQQDSEPKTEDGYVFKGIATRNFRRRFQLSEDTEVTEAKLENGLLIINLERFIPDEQKPFLVKINGGKAPLRGRAKQLLQEAK